MGLAMLWLKRIKAKFKGVDDFYVDLRFADLAAYQRMFDSVLGSIDIDTETAWSRSEEYDKVQLEKDEQTINILCQQAERRGFNPAYLIVMVHQYIFADPLQREWDEKQWAKRVVRRKEIDYFRAVGPCRHCWRG